jgi:hypothetical protein
MAACGTFETYLAAVQRSALGGRPAVQQVCGLGVLLTGNGSRRTYQPMALGSQVAK